MLCVLDDDAYHAIVLWALLACWLENFGNSYLQWRTNLRLILKSFSVFFLQKIVLF